MMKGKRLLSLLLVGAMFFCLALPSQASNYNDLKKKTEELEDKQEKTEQQGEKLEEKKE